jgi:hypothetical protein
MTDPNNNWAGEDPTTVLPRRKKGRQRIAPVALKLKSLRRLSGRLYLNRTTLRPKPAFSSLDRVSPVPIADSWVGRSGPAVSAVLAGSAGFQVSAPDRASANRCVVGCDFLDLTFYFSFAGLSVVGELAQSCSA